MGREAGAQQLRKFFEGERVTVRHRLVASKSRVPFRFALGGYPVLDDGQPLPGLDNRTSAVRTAVGIADNGRRLLLLALNGAPEYRTGLTIAEVASVMRELGSVDAFSLDGGGSSTLVARAPGAGASRYGTTRPTEWSALSPTASASSRLADRYGLRPLTMSAVAVRPLLMVGAMLVLAR